MDLSRHIPYENGGRGLLNENTPSGKMSKVIQEPVATLIIVDDHPLFRGAMRQALSGGFDAGMAGIGPAKILEAGDFGELRSQLLEYPEIDLVLLDLSMPGVSGFSGLIALRAEHAATPVVIVSANDDPATIRRALELGASGFVPKSAGIETIREAISSVLRGDVWKPEDVDLATESDPEIAEILTKLSTLTPQQTRVLVMISRGLLNKQIAYELSVSEATVKAHVSAVLQKLDVDSRTQAVIQLSKLGADAISDNSVV